VRRYTVFIFNIIILVYTDSSSIILFSILNNKLHNEELHNLYSSPSIIKMIKSRSMRWAGHAARMMAKMTAYRILVGKPEEKRPIRRRGHTWVDNIKMDLREMGWGSMDWIDLAQDRDQWRALVNTVINLQVP
jgi:hypothetical protein